MRILIVGASGRFRTEAALARAARTLGHSARVVDALGWRRRLGPLGARLALWRCAGYQPDFVLCTRHAVALGESRLRQMLHQRRSAFWYFDAGVPLPQGAVLLARLASHCFATYGYQVDALQQAGAASASFLPQGVDPLMDRPARWAPPGYRCDASFVGSGQYPRRHDTLRALATVCRLQIRGPGWKNAPPDLPVAGGMVRGAEFGRVVRAASVSIGVNALMEQPQESLGGSSNRLWRVLGAGGFFLGEYVPGVERLARAGEHAVWYRSAGEASDLLRQYLADPDGRHRIALAGRTHALAAHTYAHRLELLLRGQGLTST